MAREKYTTFNIWATALFGSMGIGLIFFIFIKLVSPTFEYEASTADETEKSVPGVPKIKEHEYISDAEDPGMPVEEYERPKEEKVFWSYQGAAGPQYWGNLVKRFDKCRTGRAQSPIDISTWEKERDRIPLHFQYRPARGRFVNTGNDVRLEFGGGLALDFLNRNSILTWVSFHTPSEHRLNGVGYDMEIQLVHRDRNGRYNIIAVLVDELGSEYKPLAKLWRKMPMPKERPAAIENFNPIILLPKDRSYYHYEGSITTPPCHEDVTWIVMQNVVKMSSKQIDRLIKAVRFNSRPVQPLNGRDIAASWK